MIQQESGNQAGLAWAQSLQRALLENAGPQQALAILMSAGWSALAALARGSDESAALIRELHESIERLREEVTRPVDVIESLLGLARHLLLSDQLVPPFLASLPSQMHPNLGPLQKQQANLDALQQALSDYHTAALHYAHEIGELFEAVVSECQRELSAAVQPEPSAQAETEQHDRCIQVAERTYERFLGSEAYTQAIAALINAWADLRLALRPIVDEILLQIGLPNRHEVDDIELHLDRLQRQQRSDTIRLQREITALRDEIATLRRDGPGPAQKPRSRRGKRL
ncbi:MAG: hypothetical protein L0H63_13140 [Nitrococcus sp.]|nr:hypothetical protein [Nitrococcus sp.]